MKRAKLTPVCVGIALATSACGAIPGTPDPGPSSWIPSVAPSPSPVIFPSGEYGFTRGQESAVRVRTMGCSDFGTGTGFILDDHHIVTNRHVIDDYETVQVTTSDGEAVNIVEVRTTSVADLAVLTTDQKLDYQVTLAVTDPRVFDYVRVVGYPLGNKLTESWGTISERTADTLDNADHVFISSAVVDHGSSGSAAYNWDGDVVGVVYAGIEELGSSIIIPVSILNEGLDSLTNLAPACDY